MGQGQQISADDDGRPAILIVDDQPDYARLFSQLAEILGVTVNVVSSCSEAVAAIEKYQIDLIFMDWIMPEENGPACTARLRKLEQKTGKRTPIIGISGYVHASKTKCLEVDMDDFLSVPFTIEELQAILAKWTKRAPVE
jgi:CheY-like chemotaxis protein